MQWLHFGGLPRMPVPDKGQPLCSFLIPFPGGLAARVQFQSDCPIVVISLKPFLLLPFAHLPRPSSPHAAGSALCGDDGLGRWANGKSKNGIIATCSRFCSSTLSLGSGNKEGSGTSVEDRASAVLRYPSVRNSSVVLGATAAAEGFPAAFALTFASSLRSFCTVLSQGT